MNSHKTCDVLIVGAGPAGLATAHGLASSGLSVMVTDSGQPLSVRGHGDAERATQGVGGAGLFSDGKFSFYPSASGLWQLPKKRQLKTAYRRTASVLSKFGLNAPPFPLPTEYKSEATERWALKSYPSFYLGLKQRLALTDYLAKTSGAQFLPNTTVSKCSFSAKAASFTAEAQNQTLTAKYLVLANGRFGPIGFPLDTAKIFRRIEVGCRIAQPSKDAFFCNMPQLDPKLRMATSKESTEWRTFCACRDGETVLTKTQGLWTVSGRADCPPSGWSNIGLNVRFANSQTATTATMQHLRKALSKKASYFDLSLSDALTLTSTTRSRLEKTYGKYIFRQLLLGIQSLGACFPEVAAAQTRLIGPTLEGVGWYPKTDSALRLPGLPAWVAGDCTGKFRGIVAALVSGYYMAECLKCTTTARGSLSPDYLDNSTP